MLYPKDIEVKIGFDQIRSMLNNKCRSTLGQQIAEKMTFSNDYNQIRKKLSQTGEFLHVVQSENNFPSQYYLDVTDAINKAKTEGVFLSERELLDISNSCKTILSCSNYFVKHQEACPHLYELVHWVSIDTTLCQKIDRKIDEDANVRDDASEELVRIRQALKSKHHQVRKGLEQEFKKALKEGYIADGATITVRDGRMVLPVSAEYKRRIKGFVHDESATGQTVFLEPESILQGNNEIRELEYAEKREVVKILIKLTDLIRDQREGLLRSYRFLGLVDFIRAKAELASMLEAILPDLTDMPLINWESAKHPLLFLAHQKQGKPVVPLTVGLSKNTNILIISGPNAGGKSVCLKTVGLLQYMLQCGLLVPVSESSKAGIFDDIFIDIGDEQSIENDLSTYSSHLRNMKHFLDKSGSKTLCLIDEFGTGTDPQFGGAIAESVLDKLRLQHVFGVITTHYSNIKNYAENNLGLINGAMKFDMANLEPLYELEVGKPGSSFSLEIARKIGLNYEVVNYAKQQIGDKNIDVDDLLLKLEKQKQEIKARDQELKEKEKETHRLKQKYESLYERLEQDKKKIINTAKNEASVILQQTNREIEKTIRHIKENKAEKKETRKMRERLGEFKEKVQIQPEEIKPKKDEVIKGEIGVGDSVRLKGQEVVGLVLAKKGKDVEVQMGALKSTLKVSRLERISKAELRKVNRGIASGRGLNINQKIANFSTTLDIRGKRAEEVFSLIDKYMDDAILASASEVKVLHGKGNGVLRKLIREHLKHASFVDNIADEHIDRGGAGITVIGLK